MKTSLISGKTQPVEELSITGHIVDGICRAAFKATFKNKQDIPVETSFTFPLPAGVCSTSFKVNFQGQKLRSRVMRDDSARLDFDDTVFPVVALDKALEEARYLVPDLGAFEVLGVLDRGEKGAEVGEKTGRLAGHDVLAMTALFEDGSEGISEVCQEAIQLDFEALAARKDKGNGGNESANLARCFESAGAFVIFVFVKFGGERLDESFPEGWT